MLQLPLRRSESMCCTEFLSVVFADRVHRDMRHVCRCRPNLAVYSAAVSVNQIPTAILGVGLGGLERVRPQAYFALLGCLPVLRSVTTICAATWSLRIASMSEIRNPVSAAILTARRVGSSSRRSSLCSSAGVMARVRLNRPTPPTRPRLATRAPTMCAAM